MAWRTGLAAVGVWVLGAGAVAQVPDVAIFADVYPTLAWRDGEKGTLRWYDLNGRTSTVGFRILLETGNRVLVSQRLQPYPGDADIDDLDEYWVESTGNWRVGKQLVPFGARGILRETAVGVRLDTRILIQNAPIQIAYVDNGSGRTRGVAGRVGEALGISFAFGNHWGIQASDLSAFQEASQLLGRGRGYEAAAGLDFRLPVGSTTVTGEWVSFREGESILDRDRDLSDLKAVWFLPDRADSLSFGWARDWTSGEHFWRFEGDFGVADKVTLRPFIRFTGDGFRDMGITTRVRL